MPIDTQEVGTLGQSEWGIYPFSNIAYIVLEVDNQLPDEGTSSDFRFAADETLYVDWDDGEGAVSGSDVRKAYSSEKSRQITVLSRSGWQSAGHFKFGVAPGITDLSTWDLSGMKGVTKLSNEGMHTAQPAPVFNNALGTLPPDLEELNLDLTNGSFAVELSAIPDTCTSIRIKRGFTPYGSLSNLSVPADSITFFKVHCDYDIGVVDSTVVGSSLTELEVRDQFAGVDVDLVDITAQTSNLSSINLRPASCTGPLATIFNQLDSSLDTMEVWERIGTSADDLRGNGLLPPNCTKFYFRGKNDFSYPPDDWTHMNKATTFFGNMKTDTYPAGNLDTVLQSIWQDRGNMLAHTLYCTGGATIGGGQDRALSTITKTGLEYALGLGAGSSTEEDGLYDDAFSFDLGSASINQWANELEVVRINDPDITVDVSGLLSRQEFRINGGQLEIETGDGGSDEVGTWVRWLDSSRTLELRVVSADGSTNYGVYTISGASADAANDEMTFSLASSPNANIAAEDLLVVGTVLPPAR